MNILTDFHHGSLFTSLQLLFEKRLGWNLYRQIGLEWAPEYFKIAVPYNNDVRTITQYLGIRDEVKKGMGKMNEIEEEKKEHYVLKGTPFNHKAVTLEQFKNMKFDIIIASIPAHLKPYTELIEKFQPQAKLIFQIGNHFNEVDYNLAKNIMASTSPVGVPKNVNTVFYHQEFDLKTFNYEPPVKTRAVRSFVHTLKTAGHFRKDWEDFLALEKALPEFKFESWGASCREGCADGEIEVAKLMKTSKFIVNLKTNGDGFGHCLWNAGFSGRPLIVRKSQYKGKLGEVLMIDGQTCFDIDKRGIDGVVKSIKELDSEEYLKMCEKMYNTAKSNCDFDKEEEKIKTFLSNLK